MASTSTKVSVGSLFSVLLVLIAVYFNQNGHSDFEQRLEEILNGLLRAEKKVSLSYKPKVAVGFGSCQDLFVHSKDVILFNPPPANPEHFHSISTKDELLKVFAYFFRHGAAAERYIKNETLFKEVLQLASRASDVHWAIGGNAPVMASRFAKEGCDVLLGAQMTKELKQFLPDEVIISGPLTEEDDIHILLEYLAGEKWGPYLASRANRFIVHNDHSNPHLMSIHGFVKHLETFNPNLLVVGGLQMMDNFPFQPRLGREKLMQVHDICSKLPQETKVHFEMASFTEEALLKNIVDLIIPFADSLGMNEQELPNFYHILKYGNVTLVSEATPRVATVLDQMRDVFDVLQETWKRHKQRKLTRLHVHTLAFQAIMTKKDSSWKNTMSAAAKAALTAHRHTCGSHRIDTAKARLILDDAFTSSLKNNAKRVHVKASRPVSCWEEGDREVCVAPVLVCTEVLQTGGGGDNISSAGLVFQI
ncbi:ADP-dependent glucokinase [Tachypleus tridentatus]|uniref:ADP-dependent glucokinase n=1 Tax=Tachypleus tridentatus TaxID=6853 RepID=UPI003FD1A554